MGFFSSECTYCNKSILNPHSTNVTNAWMAQVVCIMPDGCFLKGTYDGYGRIDSQNGICLTEYATDGNELFHYSCWVLAGNPREFTQESKHAADQGFFFDDEDYDIPDPLASV